MVVRDVAAYRFFYLKVPVLLFFLSIPPPNISIQLIGVDITL